LLEFFFFILQALSKLIENFSSNSPITTENNLYAALLKRSSIVILNVIFDNNFACDLDQNAVF